MPHINHILNASGCLISAAPGNPPAADQCRWLDIIDENPEQERQQLALLGLEPGDLENCLDRRRFPGAEIIPSGLLLHLPLRNTPEDEVSIYLTLILHKDTSVTLHQGQLGGLARLSAQLTDSKRPHDDDWPRDAPDLLGFLLEGLMEDFVALFLNTRAEVERLADCQEEDPARVPASLVLCLKHQVAHLAAQCEDHMYCLSVARSKLGRAAAPQGLRNAVLDLIQDIEHLQKSLQRLESRLADMMHQADGVLHTQTEQRVRTLTVISAIFMPLTLLTGIYGMNFADMPVLQKAGAFDILLLGMLALAVGMVGFFAWRGWFK